MALYKRGKKWWVRFTSPSGQQIRRSTGTGDKKRAQEYHDRLKAQYWDVERLGTKPNRTWEQAVVRWAKEKSYKASWRNDKTHLRWLDQHLRGVELNAITRDRIDRIIQARVKEGVKNSTVNRMLEVLRAILRKAANEWEWIDRAPAITMLNEPKRRIRWITREEAERLLEELPEHLRAMAHFALATGLRQRNVTALAWSQVDLKKRRAWVHPDQAKARKAIAVPLNAEAMVVLRQQQGEHLTRVFTYQGRPVKNANTKAWKKALKRAGITNFRWHDLRHTWASWHVQLGTPLNVLQELGGWESVEMVRRYAHLAADHLMEYADRLAKPHIVSSTKLAQSS